MQLDSDDIIKASLLDPANDKPGTPPTLEEEAVLLGDEPEPQDAQEVIMSSPECPKTTELEVPTEWSDTPSPPTPLPTASNFQGNWSQNTRRAQHSTRAQPLPTPNPNNPNDLVWAYIEEREELPSWWQEFRSLHHKGTGSLSNPQVQELVRK